MLDLRSILRLAAGALLVSISGCGCIRTPGAELERMRQREDEMQADLRGAIHGEESEEAAPEEASGAASDDDGWETRYNSLLEEYAKKRCSYVVSDGLTVLGADIPPEVRLEVQIMLADCYEQMGDVARAKEFKADYEKSIEALVKSPGWKRGREAGKQVHGAVSRLKKAYKEDPFTPAGEEVRVAVGLAKELSEASPGDVLEATLPDGGEIVYSSDRERLIEKIGQTGQDDLAASIQHDPEFGYFFAIREKVPPADGSR